MFFQNFCLLALLPMLILLILLFLLFLYYNSRACVMVLAESLSGLPELLLSESRPGILELFLSECLPGLLMVLIGIPARTFNDACRIPARTSIGAQRNFLVLPMVLTEFSPGLPEIHEITLDRVLKHWLLKWLMLCPIVNYLLCKRANILPN